MNLGLEVQLSGWNCQDICKLILVNIRHGLISTSQVIEYQIEEGLTSMCQSHKHQAFNAYLPGKGPPGYPIVLVRNTQTLPSLTLDSVTLKLCM